MVKEKTEMTELGSGDFHNLLTNSVKNIRKPPVVFFSFFLCFHFFLSQFSYSIPSIFFFHETVNSISSLQSQLLLIVFFFILCYFHSVNIAVSLSVCRCIRSFLISFLAACIYVCFCGCLSYSLSLSLSQTI